MRTFTYLTLLLVFFACSCGPSLPSPGPLPTGKDFGGTWDSNWGQIHLARKGNNISGRFKGFRTGSVSGTIEGNLLSFRWFQINPRQTGRGYLQMSEDGERLEGRWGYRKDAFKGGRWWASRAQR